MTENRKIIIFLAVTFILSYAFEFYIIFNGGMSKFGIGAIISLMWLPGLSSIITRVLTKDWKDIGLKLGTLNGFLIVFFIPLILSFVAFFICSLFDIRKMQMIDGVPLSKVFVQYGLHFAIGLIGAFGEEIGWRGFLTPKVYKAGWKYPTLYSGLIWALWHIPLVAFAGYYENLNSFVVVSLYTSLILILNIFMNWTRLHYESVFISSFAHAFYNFFFQTFWLYLLFKEKGRNVGYWEIFGGDMGILPIALYTLLIYFGIKVLKLNFKNYNQHS